jgi:hypothetical protein
VQFVTAQTPWEVPGLLDDEEAQESYEVKLTDMHDFNPSPQEEDLSLTDMEDQPRESTAPFKHHPS